jgi:hypothetical protein
MIPKRKHNLFMKRQFILKVFAPIWMFLPPCFVGQTSISRSQQNDAMLVIQHSLDAMGGNAWQRVGAATADVSVTSLGMSDTVVGKWSDDWTAGEVYSRREWTGEHGSTIRIVDGKVAKTYSGSTHAAVSSPDYDLINIAPVLPAVAFRLGLARSSCKFYLDPFSDQSQYAVVSQSCSAQFYPNKQVMLKWTIDRASAMPLSVEFPMRGHKGSVVEQIASFQGFDSSKGLKFPSHVEIRWVTAKASRLLVFSAVEFHTALDKNEFSGR